MSRPSEKKKAQPAREEAPRPEIPADAYVVSLPSFEGPLDLLLHLIQKHELDILDIPVSFITEKYLAYLAMMQTLTIDVASEYLVMAATLIHIKSKMLLPQLASEADDPEAEEAEDPRAELVRRLLEYQKYKAAAEDLGERETVLGRDVFPRGSDEMGPSGPAPFQQFGVFGLLDALEKVFQRTKTKVEHAVVFDRIGISDRIVELTQALRSRRKMLFEELFDENRTTFEVVITFLAVLEMCKLKLMRIYQADVLSPIHVELLVVDDDPDREVLDFASAEAAEGSLAAERGGGPPAPPPVPAEAAGEEVHSGSAEQVPEDAPCGIAEVPEAGEDGAPVVGAAPVADDPLAAEGPDEHEGRAGPVEA